MASYRIVLNIAGNAVTRAEALATALSTAAANATTLAAALTSVGAAGRGVPMRTIRVATAPYGATAATSTVAARAATAPIVTPMQARINRAVGITPVPAMSATDARMVRDAYQRDLQRLFGVQTATAATRGGGTAVSGRGATRGRENVYLNSAFRARLGPYQLRLNDVFRPDENGNIMGVNAASLAKDLNVAGIAMSLAQQVGSLVMKATKYATVVPVAATAIGMTMALRALRSESFGEGVRLISRREQARRGLGAGYERAESDADYLATAYGLDRSTSLSSLNVLTGLGLRGRTDNQLSASDARNLTLVGGMISQHHGVPFERVMTNIQQLLVQQVPNMRDIRELLNQAPILQRYALDEMKERNLNGVDARTYLKDQRNILSVLETYRLNTATNAGMQARGRIGLATQDAWANVAGNDEAWRRIGTLGSNLIRGIGEMANSALTYLTNSPKVLTEVENLRLIFRNIGDVFETLDRTGKTGIKAIDNFLRPLIKLMGDFRLTGEALKEARGNTQRNAAIEATLSVPEIRTQILAEFEKTFPNTGMTLEAYNKKKNDWVDNSLRNFLLSGEAEIRTTTIGREYFNAQDMSWWERNIKLMGFPYDAINQQIYAEDRRKGEEIKQSRYVPIFSDSPYDPRHPETNTPGIGVMRLDIIEAARKNLVEQKEVDTNITGKRLNTNEPTDTLSSMNRDRRSLTINFNGPIVEWNNTMNTNDPETMTQDIAQNAEQIMSAGLQKALLGATNTMSSRYI